MEYLTPRQPVTSCQRLPCWYESKRNQQKGQTVPGLYCEPIISSFYSYTIFLPGLC